MLRIIEAINSYIRLPTQETDLEPGEIVAIRVIDGMPHCERSDGLNPFGVVGHGEGEFNLIVIWFDSMVFQTDIFDRDAEWNVADPIYSGVDGKLTTLKPYEDSISLGHVIAPFDDQHNYIEVNWI